MKTLIKNAQVWDGTGFNRLNIIINREIIEDVGEACDGIFHKVIDAQGKWVLPGIVNCHVHLSLNGTASAMAIISQMNVYEALLEAVTNTSKIIKSGITTVRDCGSLGLGILSLKEKINNRGFIGPRIIACGQSLKITGGHSFGRVVDGVDEVRKAARELISEGADFIKLMASGGLMDDPQAIELDEEEMTVAVKEAAKHGMTSAAHAHNKKGILNAINSGVTTVEHGTFLDEETTNKMLENDVFLVPTFAPFVLISEDGSKVGIPANRVIMAKKILHEKMARFAKAYRSGIKVAFGTDGGAPLVKHEELVSEMEAMECAGMSRKDIIISATENAARALKLWNKIGSIEKGKYADIIIIDGNPLDDLANFNKTWMVLKGGEVVTEMGQGCGGICESE